MNLSIMIGVVIVSVFSIIAFNQHENISIIKKTNQSNPLVSTIVIPKFPANPALGQNYEPQYLVVVIGINNTVRWINHAEFSSESVEPDDHNDPLFENVNHVLKPGESFNYTFTKVGYVGFHSEQHPWLKGMVLVLPQNTTNSIQNVVLNRAFFPRPCDIFVVSCSNIINFTAQKFGSETYIEKMMIHGIDHYAVLHRDRSCVYPSSSSEDICTNADDLAILRLAGANIISQHGNITQTTSYSQNVPVNFSAYSHGFGEIPFNNGTLFLKGTSFSMYQNTTKLFGPFIFNSTVKIYGKIYSNDNPSQLFLCKSLIVHPSNHSSPICTKKGDFVSNYFGVIDFGCVSKIYTSIVSCFPEGLILHPGKYYMAIHSPYYSNIRSNGLYAISK